MPPPCLWPPPIRPQEKRDDVGEVICRCGLVVGRRQRAVASRSARSRSSVQVAVDAREDACVFGQKARRDDPRGLERKGNEANPNPTGNACADPALAIGSPNSNGKGYPGSPRAGCKTPRDCRPPAHFGATQMFLLLGLFSMHTNNQPSNQSPFRPPAPACSFLLLLRRRLTTAAASPSPSPPLLSPSSRSPSSSR